MCLSTCQHETQILTMMCTWIKIDVQRTSSVKRQVMHNDFISNDSRETCRFSIWWVFSNPILWLYFYGFQCRDMHKIILWWKYCKYWCYDRKSFSSIEFVESINWLKRYKWNKIIWHWLWGFGFDSSVNQQCVKSD